MYTLTLNLSCGHVRDSRSKYPETELDKQERWIAQRAYCDLCKDTKIIQSIGISEQEAN